MNFSVNPLATQGLDLKDPKAQKVYQNQIALCLQQLQQVVAQLAQNYTPSGPGLNDFGTITTDQTWNVQGNLFTFVRLSSAVTQTRTLTLSGLPQGGLVMVNVNVTANTLTLKMAATDGVGDVYSISAFNTTSSVVTNMVSTGIAIGGPGEVAFFGMSGFVGTNASPRLNLYYV